MEVDRPEHATTDRTLSTEAEDGGRRDVSRRHELLWEQELPYEARTLKLVSRFARNDDNYLLAGDKSGGVFCFGADGEVVWPSRGSSSLGGGSVYSLAFVHPSADGSRLPDPRRDSCLVAAGTGSGDLVFLDYQTGKPVSVASDCAQVDRLNLGSSILALLYIEALQELWVALAGGSIDRLVFSLAEGTPRFRRKPSVQIGEAISTLSFMPSGEAHREGWVCAGTCLGNLYHLDHLAEDPFPAELCRPSCAGPIRDSLSLSRVVSRYGWTCHVLAVAQGGDVRYLVQEKCGADPGRPGPQPVVLDRPCAERVFCLARVDFGDAVWLLVGANDRRLRFFRLAHREHSQRLGDLVSHFADRQYTLDLPQRVLAVAVREHRSAGTDGDSSSVDIYAALGDHRLRAFRLLPTAEMVRRARQRFSHFRSLGDALEALRRAPHDPDLRREITALLFRTRWLEDLLKATTWTASEFRDLRLLVYLLLSGAKAGAFRAIQSGLVAAARRHPSLRPTATRLVRHIAKYCQDGASFSDKRRHLAELAEFNERNGGDYLFDAALYRSLQAERRYSEQYVFKLPAPVISLQSLERTLPWAEHGVLATSYQRGAAWLLATDGNGSKLEIQALTEGGNPARLLQRVIFWEDPASGERHALFFYRDLGWTSIALSELSALDAGDDGRTKTLTSPRRVNGCEGTFYVYSHALIPGGLIAVGGRFGDVRLIKVHAAAGSLQVTCLPSSTTSVRSEQFAPVRTLDYRALENGGGELFAGCENGLCFRLTFDGHALGEPQPLWESSAPIRVIACHDSDQVIIGDGSGLLLLLRRFPSGKAAQNWPSAEFGIEWAVKLNAGATGIAATTLRVPRDSAGLSEHEERRVIVVSDSTGVLHVVRFEGTREHSFAIRLDGEDGPQVLHLVALSPFPDNAPSRQDTRLAVACFDQTVRILSIGHRREGVRLLNADLARAVIDALQSEHPDLGSGIADQARQALGNAVDSNLSIPEIRAVVLAALKSAPQSFSITEGDVVAALEGVGWKLASAKIASESAEVLSLRLRFDDAESFSNLIDHLRVLASGNIRTSNGTYPHLQLRYCLRFAFKALTPLLDREPPLSAGLASQLARFVHCCHDLAQNWGPDSSTDNLRCKLAVAHMLFRFATRQSLEVLLGHALDESLASIGGRSMTSFLEDWLLNDPRAPVPFRAVQHIRRMVEHDLRQDCREPVLAYCIPLLIRRFRQCRTMQEDAWVGMEIYLCIQAVHKRYSYSLWNFLVELLDQGCPIPLLEFLAERLRVLPPSDSRCVEVVEALRKAAGERAGVSGARAGFRVLFESLPEPNSLQSNPEASLIGLASCLRLLAAVAISFDPGSDHELRAQARSDLLSSDAWSLAEARSISASELRHLLACARLAIRLAAAESFEGALAIYRELAKEFGLLASGSPTNAERSGQHGPDVIRYLFLATREALQRQLRIESDFVAPMRFLQQGVASEETPVDEGLLGRRLLDFARLHSELAHARTSFLLRLDPDQRGIVMEQAVGPESRQVLTRRSEVKRRLAEVVGEETDLEPLRKEALALLDAGPPSSEAPPLELFDLSADSLGEMIPIHKDDQRYGLLFFAYPRTAAPDPSQRALSRMVPQFLMSQFMRSVQTRRLLSVTFHHISSPIAAMRSILRLLREGRVEHLEEQQFLESLWFMVEDCRMMIENHQSYVRIARGIRPPILLKRFDISEEVEFRRRVVFYKYKGHQQVLRWSASAKPMTVFLDQMMVGDIVQNLLDNACKYSPAKSEVLINLAASKKNVFIEISDEGDGLPEHVAASLFTEGVRGEVAEESRSPGLGLGLFMVYRYTMWLGGDVWFEPKRKGGTTFTVRLPREGKA